MAQLAKIYTQQGQAAKGIALYQQSLEISAHIGDVQATAVTLHELAGINAHRGQIEEAIALYKQSLVLTESIDDIKTKATTLHNLGQLFAYKKGDFDTALDYLQQSLDILHCLQSPNAKRVNQAIARVQQMGDNRG